MTKKFAQFYFGISKLTKHHLQIFLFLVIFWRTHKFSQVKNLKIRTLFENKGFLNL